ncbi:MAG: hypothetical protein IT162_19375 [Bryobacterales bacterium]|nr:hypothetical protein [Bryobacterales bacterium]
MFSILRTTVLALMAGALTMTLAQTAAAPMMADATYDVRNGDQKGKLMIKQDDLAFESLTDGKRSRNWKYSEIRTFEKKGKKELRVRPFKGDRYDFQFDDRKLADQIYQQVSQRIVAARQSKK